jgi:hypothetical protein
MRAVRHRRRCKAIAHVFDNPRRSTVYFQIVKAVQAGMLMTEEHEVFSGETRAILGNLTSRGFDNKLKP